MSGSPASAAMPPAPSDPAASAPPGAPSGEAATGAGRFWPRGDDALVEAWLEARTRRAR